MNRKFFYILLCTGSLMLKNELSAQEIVSMENQPISEQPTLIVCKLTGPEFQKRKEALRKEVFAEVKRSEKIDNGYALHFMRSTKMLVRVADYMIAEHECCPFFDFNLAVSDDKIIWAITGPSEAVSLIETLINDM